MGCKESIPHEYWAKSGVCHPTDRG
jgi:hypothetical protein